MVSRRIRHFQSRKVADRCDLATANSAFFTVLSPEVRLSILIAAFGGRTVHIERCRPESLQSQIEAPAFIPQPGALGTARQWLGELVAKTKAKTVARHSAGRRTQLCGCICSRLPDESPAEDTCLGDLRERQRAARCSCASPPELAVGAIGWLLACRQAYVEGVKILYSNNNFVIRTTSQRVFGGLFPRIPATILSQITSVEFVMEALFISYKDYVALPETDKDEPEMLKRTLSSVPSLMPNLRRLYIGFCPDTCLVDGCQWGNALEYECTKHIASLLKAMALEFEQMGRYCDIELGLPYKPFNQYRHEAIMQSCRFGIPEWKPRMPSKYSYYPRSRLFWPAQNKRPDAKSETDKGGEPGVGYWISQTQYEPGSLTDSW